jgi:RNA polymerase sigma-70 factor (ECF subfamily)
MNGVATWHRFNYSAVILSAARSLSREPENVSEEQLQNRDRDVELLRQIGRGDQAAFAQFYDLYSSLLFSFAVKVLNDPKEAEDVVQDSFLQIWEKAATFDPALGKPSSWAITLTRNKAIDRIRASQRRQRLAEEAAAEDPAATEISTANESVHGREKAAIIRSAIAELPLDQRSAIEMAFFAGLTQNEISDNLREPLGTIKARIRRGMLKLRDKLEGCL